MTLVNPAAAAVPCLRLGTETIFVGSEEVRAAALRLDFEVAGLRLRATGARWEAEARRVLEALGAIEIDALDDCAVAPGVAVDYVLRLDGDVHALCAFSAYAVPQLTRLGWKIEIDQDYPWQVVDAGAPLYADVAPDEKRPDWFGLELGVEIDGCRVDLLPAMLDLLEATPSLEALGRLPRKCIAVRVDERRWLPVPPERLKLVLQVLRELYRGGAKTLLPARSAVQLAHLGAALHGAGRAVRWTGDRSIRDTGYALALGPRASSICAPPVGLQADLRPYQVEGVAWLAHLRSHDAGGVLADDMGLGKTLQTIAHLLAEKEAGRLDRPALIVTLTSCAGNWSRELARFAPSLRVVALRGPGRAARLAQIDDHDVAITTFPLLVRDREELVAREYSVLVLDEAHTIKNHHGQAHDAARALKAAQRIALTGTPIENHLGELWSVMEFLNPGLLGDLQRFTAEFRQPIEQMGDLPRLNALRERVRPFILRRTKDAVAKELPPKTEIVRAVELSGAQRELYESIRVAAHADVRAQIKQRGIGGAQIAILDALLKLRQVCCDPRLVNVEAARSVERSEKLELALELIAQLVGEGRKILLFSQFARMLALISEGLLARGIGHVALTGSTPDRQKPIDAFQAGRAPVFLISLRAGGTGLNLTAADTVIHYDPWWNPAVQAQATDRAYRIGQTKPVFVYNLIAAGSVEERMLALQQHKRRLADAILAAGGTAGAALTERDVDDLLSPLE
ncbi:MAG TPA: DEAD/DEAH box helicase [Kofleriaceae bacterium]|nr:DEAD/DEAH box helicase [Kofleriaceae bacterium]